MRIAFIGLGAMGLPMARNLAKADGIDLVLYDLDAAKLAEAAELGRVADSFADAVADAEYVFTVLPADPHVRAVGEQLRDHGHPGQVYVDFSTIAPETIRHVAGELAPRRIDTVSAALLRSTAAAQQGTLALFLGGAPERLAELRPAFDAVATDLQPTPGIEAAKTAKIVNNMVVAALDILACETLVLGNRLGFAAPRILAAMAEGGAGSWVLGNHIEKYVLPDDLGPGRFSTAYMSKDVGLCGALARAAGQPGYFTGLARAYYRGVRAHGHTDDYHMIVIRWLEQGAAIPDPVTSRTPDPGTESELATCVRAAAAVQTLVTIEALTLAAHNGLPAKQAAEFLEGGSGANAAMNAVLTADPSALAQPMPELAEFLDAACDLAERENVPATIFELARNVARSHGPTATADTLLAGLPR